MALITVLLVVAVLSALLARLSLSNEVWIRQVQGGVAMAQAREVSRTVQQWVALILVKDTTKKFDGRTDIWARPVPPLPVEWGEIEGRIEDMQGRFNLNNLVNQRDKKKDKVNPLAKQRFSRLLRVLELPSHIADATIDWIDSDSRPRPRGAEDGFYRGRRPPYLAANRALGEATELRLVRGVTSEAWRKLRPHVAALPEEATGINVNTASPEVLAAVFSAATGRAPRQALGPARKLAKRAQTRPFEQIQDVAQVSPLSQEELPDILRVSTSFFRARTEARFGPVNLRMMTLYERTGSWNEQIGPRGERTRSRDERTGSRGERTKSPVQIRRHQRAFR